MKIGYSDINSSANRMYSKSYENGAMKGTSFGGFVESKMEKEQTKYNACGEVKTEDGRSIDISVQLEMERSKKIDTFIRMSSPLDELCDPLIINIDSASVNVFK